MAQPNRQCSLCFIDDSWRGRWPSKRLDKNSQRSALMFIFQVFSPAKVIFAGAGVLLLVRIHIHSHELL